MEPQFFYLNAPYTRTSLLRIFLPYFFSNLIELNPFLNWRSLFLQRKTGRVGELYARCGKPSNGSHGLEGRWPGQGGRRAGRTRTRHTLPSGQVTWLVHGEEVGSWFFFSKPVIAKSQYSFHQYSRSGSISQRYGSGSFYQLGFFIFEKWCKCIFKK